MSGGLDYRESGVDLDEARRSLDSITESVRSTFTPDVASDIGSFGGVFAGSFPGMDEPMLVSSIDGVGTKSMVAAMTGQFAGLGRDIVCHCIDDILVQGAKPLFFLDYFGAGRLTSDVLTAVVAGAAGACRENGVALLGGETAEMPGVYLQGEIDVVGSIVGVVDRKNMLPQPNIGTGDLVVGIASDGLHTNGFALARRALFERAGRRHDETIPVLGRSLGEELLRPHRSYYRAVEPMLSEDLIRGMAHITGGGLIENLPRALPPDCSVMIERRAWTPLPIFQMIQEDGSIADEEMFRVFNMGIGICLICRSEVASAVVQRLNDSGETAYVIGEVVKAIVKFRLFRVLMRKHTLQFHGKVLERGFWIYVWKITDPNRGHHFYVGRTGDSSSANAQSPFNRVSAHLEFNENSNTLRRHLKTNGLQPESCDFHMTCVGPIHTEIEEWGEHKSRRDDIAAIEEKLSCDLRDAGYRVINNVHCKKILNKDLYSEVKSLLEDEFPKLREI